MESRGSLDGGCGGGWDGGDEFVFGAGFPAAVDPEVLAGVDADEGFDGLGVALGDVAEGVGLGFPVLGEDDVLGADIEVELSVAAAGVADDHGDVVPHGEQADGFVGRGATVEEVDEYALFAGVLIGDESDGATGFEDIGDFLECAGFGEDALAAALADAEDPVIDVGVVEGAGDGGGVEAEGGQKVSEDFPVAVMAGEHDQAAVFVEEQAEGGVEVVEGGDFGPVVVADEAGGEEHFDAELEELAHGAFGDEAALGFGEFGECKPEVFQGAVAVFFVQGVHDVAEELGAGEAPGDGVAVDHHGDGAEAHVLEAVDEVVAGFGHGGRVRGKECR